MAKRPRSAGGTPATTALARAGVEFALHPYQHDPRTTSYGLEAAEALGVDARRVLKTLMARLDGELVVGIVPVSGQLDLKALARTLGGARASLADLADAERATGYVAGGDLSDRPAQAAPHRCGRERSGASDRLRLRRPPWPRSRDRPG